MKVLVGLPCMQAQLNFLHVIEYSVYCLQSKECNIWVPISTDYMHKYYMVGYAVANQILHATHYSCTMKERDMLQCDLKYLLTMY
jgi:hypothetical protein